MLINNFVFVFIRNTISRQKSAIRNPSDAVQKALLLFLSLDSLSYIS